VNNALFAPKKLDIGPKYGYFHGCSLIVSRYGKKDGPQGRVALLGPTRMNYEKTISTLEYFTELIDEMLVG